MAGRATLIVAGGLLLAAAVVALVMWRGAGEDDKHAQMLVAGEAVLGTGGNEYSLALPEVEPLVLDLQPARALEDDVDLVD